MHGVQCKCRDGVMRVGSPDWVQFQPTVQVSGVLMFLDLHGLQHPPLPISRFLKQDFCPFPVLLVLVFSSHAQLFRSSHPLFLLLTCALLTSSAGFFPSLRLLQSKHGTLYTTPFFITSSCGVCTLVKSSRKVPCDLNTAILDPI